MSEAPKWFRATVAEAKDFFKKDQLVKQGINNVDEDIVMDQENYTSVDWEAHLKTLPKVDPPDWTATKESVEKILGPEVCGLIEPGALEEKLDRICASKRKEAAEEAEKEKSEWTGLDFSSGQPKLTYEPVTNTNWKPSNPKDLMGIRKVSLCTVSGPVLYEVALGMQEGGMKYGRHNYRSEGVAASTYIDAGMRHLWEYWEGEDIDPESGVHHISKAISTLFVLRDAILNSKCTDDRPIRPKNPEWLKGMNAQASALVDKYPLPENPYTHRPLPER